jgi:hypothetical protein
MAIDGNQLKRGKTLCSKSPPLPSPTEVPPSPRAGGRALVLPWTSAHSMPLRMVAALGLKLNIPAFGCRPYGQREYPSFEMQGFSYTSLPYHQPGISRAPQQHEAVFRAGFERSTRRDRKFPEDLRTLRAELPDASNVQHPEIAELLKVLLIPDDIGVLHRGRVAVITTRRAGHVKGSRARATCLCSMREGIK